jgi:hypothetical protein
MSGEPPPLPGRQRPAVCQAGRVLSRNGTFSVFYFGQKHWENRSASGYAPRRENITCSASMRLRPFTLSATRNFSSGLKAEARLEELIASGTAQHVSHQREIIADLEQAAHDTIAARELLRLFEKLYGVHVADRDRLRRDLASFSDRGGID